MLTPDLPIYFDYNGTTPVDPQVTAALLPYLQQHFGNLVSVMHANNEVGTIQPIAEIAGVAASAGAACHADIVKISQVLEAMGLPQDLTKGTLKFSLGRTSTADEAVQGSARPLAALTGSRP